MRGYPKRVATKQDFINLLSIKKFKELAISDLKQIYYLQDDECIKVISGTEETEDLVTEKATNPMPLWKQKGFQNRDEIAKLIVQNGGII